MSAEKNDERRLFCALAIGDAGAAGDPSAARAVRAAVAAQSAMAPGATRWRPTRRDNLHVTLAFLGMCDAGAQAAATDALAAACAAVGPFEVVVSDVRTFRKRDGAVVWAGVSDPTGALAALQARLRDGLVSAGLPGGPVPYVPHVTLARSVRVTGEQARALECRGATDAVDALCSLGAEALGATAVRVTRASLMWSHSVEGSGLTYTPLATFGLGGPSQTGAHE